MCRRVTCRDCGRPTFAGCGRHVEQVLADVPHAERCRCGDVPASEKGASIPSPGLRGLVGAVKTALGRARTKGH